MSNRLADIFSFRGRLGRAAYWRRQRWSMLIGGVAIIPAIFLLMAGVQAPLALFPTLVLPAVLIAEAAAYVRRLHDVGRHAHRVLARDVAVVGLILAPLVIAVTAGATLQPYIQLTLLWLSGVGLIVGVVAQVRHPLRRVGDVGANAFGPPSAP